jgi:hypothetical protein
MAKIAVIALFILIKYSEVKIIFRFRYFIKIIVLRADICPGCTSVVKIYFGTIQLYHYES